MSVPRFDVLFKEPGVADALYTLPEADSTGEGGADSNSTAMQGIRDCLGLCGDTTKCLRQRGTEDPRCLNLFLQSRGCLASRLGLETKPRFDAMDECMQREKSFNKCGPELRQMHAAVEKKLKKMDEDLPMSGIEQDAWERCGSPTQGASVDHLNVILGCAMQVVCPQELNQFVACSSGECVSEKRALLGAFRPYMEKVWLRDPLFLVRGASEFK